MTIENASGLTGDSSKAEDTTGSDNVNKSGFDIPLGRAKGKVWPGSSGTNEASVTVTTPADSLVIVAAACSGWLNTSGSGTMSVRVLDGTTVLKTGTLSVGNTNDAELLVLFVGIPLTGSRTYHVQCWNTNGDALMYATIAVSHVQLTDTHAAPSPAIIEN